MVGKAKGVPTLLFRGVGLDGRHAWFGFLDSDGHWELDCGRYADQKLTVSLLRRDKDTLDQIEAAIQRIEDGGYGRCEECGEQIPKTRLDAIPYAAECVRCASQREEGHEASEKYRERGIAPNDRSDHPSSEYEQEHETQRIL